MGLKDLNIQLSYAGKGDQILKDFLLPSISEAICYDRITSFFTVESLLAISQGIDSLYQRHGKMRLIIGIHSFPPEFVDASIRREYLQKEIQSIRLEVSEGISTLSDKLKKDRLATLAWMVEDGLLEIKAAAVKGPGIFHPKTLLLTDGNGDKLVAVGSPNETTSGLGGNFEQIIIATSWETPASVTIQEQFFDSLWRNEHDDAIVLDVSEDTAVMILSSLGNEYQRVDPSKSKKAKGKGLIDASSKMLANFFVSGDVPALYVHQEKAVIEALSRWPIRVLFSDEVGLGKTFEVAATMSFMIKYCGIKRVIILTPKSVLKQWQDELSEHFDLNVWLYESASKSYIDPHGKSINMGKKNPIGKGSPDIILMSAQYARGSGAIGDVFSLKDSILPDLLIVDEAHSARMSKSVSGTTQKTRIYRMLERVSRLVPHLILATATPMQKDANEYHAILNLLGLPKIWQKTRNYQTSLQLISSEDSPDTSDAYTAANLLLKTIREMSPDLSKLNPMEIAAVQDLLQLQEKTDQFEIGSYVQRNWKVFRSTFIKLHPAHLLTVRNTRRSLSQIGYKFPKRNLIEESIEDSMPIQLFYHKVDKYISNECFSIEQVLYPNRKISLGFIRVSYRQRVASSLYSCKESLSRRYEKTLALKKILEQGNQIQSADSARLNPSLYWDSLDSDELLGQDIDETDTDTSDIDFRALKRAVGIESTALSSLIREADLLLHDHGDLKICRSIALAERCLLNGDAVLLFSRYTDTIDALLREFKQVGAADKYAYAIYTGQQSVIVTNGIEVPCDKNTLKKELFSGRIRIIFCSDAASEGLNLQAARVLINVDVPWTPARLEQRIGRIARLGQVADEVDIYNVWYPYSIEARMYHRIQTRLKATNLAIGEFPEIVATSIRTALLDGNDEDTTGMEQLNEIRNSYQISALEALWNRSGEGTESEIIRKELIAICDREFPVVSRSLAGAIATYQMPDSTLVELTAKDGMQESISLKSLPWKYIDFTNEQISIITDEAGRLAAFGLNLAGKNQMISHESVFQIILDGELDKVRLLVNRPQMLPDSTKLNLSFSTDCILPASPIYWLK